MYVCPKCGKQRISLHRRTYEKQVIVFCDNCRFNGSVTPSKEAYLDSDKAWEEFLASYNLATKKT
ncbi:MAG: hypothetical protein ACQCN6_10495 [Candidatus Bathyarchaeia archaeon]|jgi:ribosomal protein L37AE/L43A